MLRTANSKSKTKKSPTSRPIRVEVGSGNVFADIGVPQPGLALVKAQLVQQIRNRIAERELTQMKAAELLGIDQPKVSALVRGRTDGYTIERLFKFLNLFGQDVEITLKAAEPYPAVAETRVVI